MVKVLILYQICPVKMTLTTLIFSILRIQLKLNTALLSTVRSSVCPPVTGVTSHISHIYKGMNAMLSSGTHQPLYIYIYSESKSSWLSF